MINVRKATAQDVDELKQVVRDSVLALCKDFYTHNQLESLLTQYPGREVYEKWLHERLLLVAVQGEDDSRVCSIFSRQQLHRGDACFTRLCKAGHWEKPAAEHRSKRAPWARARSAWAHRSMRWDFMKSVATPGSRTASTGARTAWS